MTRRPGRFRAVTALWLHVEAAERLLNSATQHSAQPGTDPSLEADR